MTDNEQWFVDEAQRQTQRAALVDCTNPPTLRIDSPTLTVAAFDVQWQSETSGIATCVLFQPHTASILLSLSCAVQCAFPRYRVGFLAAREVPSFLRLLSTARVQHGAGVDVCMVDGGGQLHPRRYGSACELGVKSGVPTIGVSKSLLRRIVTGDPTEQDVRAWMVAEDVRLLVLNDESGEPVTCAVAGSEGSRKAVFVSVGHRITLLAASRLVLLCQRYVVPEPIRHADLLARRLVRAAQGDDKRRDERNPTLPTSHIHSHSLSASNHLALPSLSDTTAHYSAHDLATPLRPQPLLLHVIPPIRSLFWQFMDNSSAWQYLNSCKQLHGLYHTFPLTETINATQFHAIPLIRRMYRVWTGRRIAVALLAVLFGITHIVRYVTAQPVSVQSSQ